MAVVVVLVVNWRKYTAAYSETELADETERLRDTVLDRDQEIATQRGLIEGHEGENMQVSFQAACEMLCLLLSDLKSSVVFAARGKYRSS